MLYEFSLPVERIGRIQMIARFCMINHIKFEMKSNIDEVSFSLEENKDSRVQKFLVANAIHIFPEKWGTSVIDLVESMVL